MLNRDVLLMGNYYGRGQKQQQQKDEYQSTEEALKEKNKSHHTKENFELVGPRGNYNLGSSRSFQVPHIDFSNGAFAYKIISLPPRNST